MSGTPISDEEWLSLWNGPARCSPAEMARIAGHDIRSVYRRRNKLAALGQYLQSIPSGPTGPKIEVPKWGFRRLMEIKGGHVVIASDGHFWPGERSIAFDAYIKIIKRLHPKLIVLNGDALDGSKISRHSPGSWADLPEVADELAAVQERMGEIEAAAEGKIPLVLCCGNHDARFSATLARVAPDFIRVKGTDLADHLPAWNFCWSLWINDNVVVKHQYHNGIHAAWNNVLKSGKTIVTGHTHRLQMVQFADYNGLRCGIECGMLSEVSPESDKYAYALDNPQNWSQGFVVLTFDDKGTLLEPEFARVINGRCYFRGEPIQ